MAAPLGLSIHDIDFSIDRARSIQSTWFDRCSDADALYIEFGRDINAFNSIIIGFCDAFKRFTNVYRARLHENEYIAWSQKTSKELLGIVGDFYGTLEECQQLLEENQAYIAQTASPWEKDRWQLAGSPERAAKLRSQIQTHAAKIDLLERHFVRASTSHMASQHQSLVDNLPMISPELASRYYQAIEMDRPSQYTSMANFPLKEGLDALLEALHHSIPTSTGSYGIRPRHPEIQQLNNLAKARWIYHCMFQSRTLQSTGRESLWKWALESIHDELRVGFEQYGDILIADQRNIMVLAPQHFRIWEAPEIWELPTIPDDREGEEKILQVPLVDPSRGLKRDLIIFKRPTNELRLVASASPLVTSTGDAVKSHDDEKIINIHSVQVIPRYAYMNISRLSSRLSNVWPRVMELRLPGATGSYRYEFKSDNDLHKFQHALLGYKVVHEQYSCQWILHRPSLLRSKGLSGSGRIQLWQPKPLADPQVLSTGRGSINTTGSSGNSHSNFTLSRVPGQPPGSPEPILESGNVLMAARPPVPVILIFTEVEKKPTILYLKLQKSLTINPANCQCGSTNERKRSQCKRTVLEKNPPTREEFTVRKMSANVQGNITDLNLSVFASPRHPGISGVKKIKDVGWLSIDAEDPQGREDLQVALHTLEQLRDRDQQKFQSTINALRNRADRPRPSIASPSLKQDEFFRRDSGVPNSTFRMPFSGPSSLTSARPDSMSIGPTEMPNNLFRMSSGALSSGGLSTSPSSRTESITPSLAELPENLSRFRSGSASIPISPGAMSPSHRLSELPDNWSRLPSGSPNIPISPMPGSPYHHRLSELPANVQGLSLGNADLPRLSRSDTYSSGPVELP